MGVEPHLQSVPTGLWSEDKQDVAEAPPGGSGGAGDTGGTGGTSPKPRGPVRQRADRNLPTDRVKFNKQIEALSRYAQMSGPGRRPVTAEDLGATLELSPNTAGLCGGFFKDSGWVSRVNRAYAATDALIEYHRDASMGASEEEALVHLSQVAQQSWYWEAVQPLLAGGVPESVLLRSLIKAANATSGHKRQLLLVLEWLEWLGLIRREGETIYPGRVSAGVPVSAAPSDLPPDSPSSTTSKEDQLIPEESGTAREQGPQGLDEAVGSLISFNFSVRITPQDVAALSPEQLTALLEVVEKLRG